MIEPTLLETRPSEDCGCPEEEWLFGGANLIIHEEADGQVHAFLDAGDWDTEVTLPFPTLERGGAPIFAWAHDSMHGLFVDANARALAVAPAQAAERAR